MNDIIDKCLPKAIENTDTDHVVVVTNTTINKIYPDYIFDVLNKSGVRVSTCVLPDGEEYKNLETLSQIFDFTDSIHILRYNDLERSSYEIIKEKKHLEFFTNHQNKLKAKFNDPVKNLAAESVFSTIMQHQKV